MQMCRESMRSTASRLGCRCFTVDEDAAVDYLSFGNVGFLVVLRSGELLVEVFGADV